MHTTAVQRTIAARQSIRDWTKAWTVRPTNRPTERASLRGLEVQESDFGAWLAAGGDRRSAARPVRLAGAESQIAPLRWTPPAGSCS